LQVPKPLPHGGKLGRTGLNQCSLTERLTHSCQ